MRRPKRGEAIMRYSEILRLVGQYVERADLTDIRIVETEDGLILQGRVMRGEHAGQCDTYQLTPEDLSALQEDAFVQRGRKI
ncbi:MAG: hypothetical protein HZB51_25925 [Chloroflexi bacterium]|nr:hypothetical protein [Chloroflexota bacterium]